MGFHLCASVLFFACASPKQTKKESLRTECHRRLFLREITRELSPSGEQGEMKASLAVQVAGVEELDLEIKGIPPTMAISLGNALSRR